MTPGGFNKAFFLIPSEAIFGVEMMVWGLLAYCVLYKVGAPFKSESLKNQ